MTGLYPVITPATAAEYTYYTVDIVTNKVLAQIPFEDVTYERVLKGSGNFDGKISINNQTKNLDLYNSTLPGKTALYVVRNGECMWGGIIWSRSYDMVGRSLAVSGQEFTSYLQHRIIWKTYSYNFAAQLTKTTKTGAVKIKLTEQQLKQPLKVSDGKGGLTKVYVSFKDAELIKYSDYYAIESAPSPTVGTFYVMIPKLPPRSGTTFDGVTVSVRVDTYEYLRELMKEAAIDFVDTEFANEVIAPGIKTGYDITYRQITSNYAFLTTSDSHGLVAGQRVEIRNVDSLINGYQLVASVPTPTTFSVLLPTYKVYAVSLTSGEATLYLDISNTNYDFKYGVGDILTIAGVATTGGVNFNGDKTITSIDIYQSNNVNRAAITFNRSGADVPVTYGVGGTVSAPDMAVNSTILGPTRYGVYRRQFTTSKPIGIKSIKRVSVSGTYLVTITTSTPHSFKKNDTISVVLEDAAYKPLTDGVVVVASDQKKRTLSYQLIGVSGGKNKETKKVNSAKNTVSFAIPINELVISTTGVNTFSQGDVVHVTGVDAVDWTRPLYDGYQTITQATGTSDATTTAIAISRTNNVLVLYSNNNFIYDDDDTVEITISGAYASLSDTYRVADINNGDNNGASTLKVITSTSGSIGYTTSGGFSIVGRGQHELRYAVPEYGPISEPGQTLSIDKIKYYGYKNSSNKKNNWVTIKTNASHNLVDGDRVSINSSTKMYNISTGVVVLDNDKFKYKLTATSGDHAPKAYKAEDNKWINNSGSVTKVYTTVGTIPSWTVSSTGINCKDNLVTMYAADHELSVGMQVYIDLPSGYENYQNAEKKTTILDVDANTFTYYVSDPATVSNVGITSISSFSITNKVATVTATAHGMVYASGRPQIIRIYGVTGTYSYLNGDYELTATTTNTFKFKINHANVSSTAPSGSPKVSGYKDWSGYGTIYISHTDRGDGQSITQVRCVASENRAYLTVPDHGLSTGDYIRIDIPGKTYKKFNIGDDTVAVRYEDDNHISYVNTKYLTTNVALTTLTIPGTIVPKPYVSRSPVVFSRSYGEFPENADMGGLEFSETGYSGKIYSTSIIRGSDMTVMSNHLEQYTNNPNGFDYRIDCAVSYDTNGFVNFKRTFVLVPITPITYDEYIKNIGGALPKGKAASPIAFGADKLSFEYPGNIENVSMSENSQNSATRFFVVGNNDDTGSAASARFSGASAFDLLEAGWPILDKFDKVDWPIINNPMQITINKDGWGNYDAEGDFYKTAQRSLYESRPPAGDFIIRVNGSLNPVVGSYNPGDWCQLIINDEAGFVNTRLASILEPRKDVIVRKIDAISVSVPNSPAFPEEINLTLVPDWQVDKVGK